MLLNLGQVKQVLQPKITVGQTAHSRLSQLFRDRSIYREVEAVLPDGSSPWPITPELGRFLARLVVQSGCRNVLEFGAGSSSLVLAHALSMTGGGRLTSVEQDPTWCASLFEEVGAVKDVDSRLVGSDLQFKVTAQGFYHAYEKAAHVIAQRGPYDLVLIDGPQTFYGRDGGLHSVYAHLAPNALIVLDDAKRQGEQWTMQRWLQTYPGLDVALFDPTFSERGVAVLVNQADQGKQTSLSSLFSSGCFALKNWYYRRQLHIAC